MKSAGVRFLPQPTQLISIYRDLFILSIMDSFPSFMFDTNVFNQILDGAIDLSWLKGMRIYATHVQQDEIANTPETARKNQLLSTFNFVTTDQVSSESAVWGVSRWGKAKWKNPDNIFSEMLTELNALNKNKSNNSKDILIAETAFRKGWILVTSDKDLFLVATKFRIPCANAFLLQKYR